MSGNNSVPASRGKKVRPAQMRRCLVPDSMGKKKRPSPRGFSSIPVPRRRPASASRGKKTRIAPRGCRSVPANRGKKTRPCLKG